MTGHQQINEVGFSVLEWDDRSDSKVRPPIAKWQALFFFLRRWWGCSLLRIMLSECYRFPLRIAAILRTSELAYGPVIPLTLCDHSPARLYPPSSFLLACTSHIQQLQSEVRWVGYLEAQLLAQAFQQGARWAENSGSEKCNVNVP